MKIKAKGDFDDIKFDEIYEDIHNEVMQFEEMVEISYKINPMIIKDTLMGYAFSVISLEKDLHYLKTILENNDLNYLMPSDQLKSFANLERYKAFKEAFNNLVLFKEKNSSKLN